MTESAKGYVNPHRAVFATDDDDDAEERVGGLGLGRSVLAGRLADPRATAAVAVLAALIIFWIVRRSR